MQQTHNKFLKIILSVVGGILILVSSYFAYTAYQKHVLVQESEARVAAFVETGDMTAWPTFTSATGLYSVRYPDWWEVENSFDPFRHTETMDGPVSYETSTVTFTDPNLWNSEGLNDHLIFIRICRDAIKCGAPLERFEQSAIASKSEIVLGNLPAWEVRIKTVPGLANIITTMPYKDSYIRILGDTSTPEHDKIFRAIAGSFTLLK